MEKEEGKDGQDILGIPLLLLKLELQQLGVGLVKTHVRTLRRPGNWLRVAIEPTQLRRGWKGMEPPTRVPYYYNSTLSPTSPFWVCHLCSLDPGSLARTQPLVSLLPNLYTVYFGDV